MKAIAIALRTATALCLAAALLLAGCAREELANPAGSVVTITEIGLDGTATLEQGDIVVTARTGNVRFLDAYGNLISETVPTNLNGQVADKGVQFADYIPGVRLELREALGGLRRFLNVPAPLDLPAGTVYVEFVDYLDVPADLRVLAENTLKAGKEVHTGNSFTLVDQYDNVAFSVPAPIAWDANGHNRPWMMYRLNMDAAGTLEVGTQVLASWLTNPAADFPLTIDPTVTPGAPAPFVATGHLAPVAPYNHTVNLAFTYSNAYNDSLQVTIEWGDGATQTFVTNMQIQELHTYADGTDGVTVTIQLSDFSVDENGDPAPRTVRETLTISLDESTDDTIPGSGGDCGFTAIAEDDLDWSDDSDDSSNGSERSASKGEPLGFDFELDGQTYTHFNIISDGWVQLLDGQTDYYGDSRDDMCEWWEDYEDDGEGGAFIFCAYDDWDAGEEGGYYGYKLESDRAIFYWHSMTYDDADEGEDEDHVWSRSVEILSSGEVHFNFGPEAYMEDYDEDLFTGLFVPAQEMRPGGGDDDLSGTFVWIADEDDGMPYDICFVYPNEEFETIASDDICDCEEEEEDKSHKGKK
jgi:hypothetical protein